MYSAQANRQEKPEVRQASRDAAMREVKERAKKLKAEKAAKAGDMSPLPPISCHDSASAAHRLQAPSKGKAPAQQKAGKVGQGKR
eukprot:1149577-Pelagomonas_calceolata.AAC.1